MYLVLEKFYEKFVFVYFDNIIIYSKTREEYIQHLQMVLTEIRKAELKIKPAKCQWFKTELKYLGYTISRKGITTDPTNVAKL